MPDFIPGIELNQAYYWEAVRPILDAALPRLPHSAALIGYGSDVMGFDTPVSRDHMWGPRLLLFLPEENFAETHRIADEALRRHLPVSFRGYSTNFSAPDAQDGGTRSSQEIEHGPVDHLIFFRTIRQMWQNELDFDPAVEPAPADWLTFSEQGLISLTAGRVYHDGLGLEAVRARFAYYPREVWLYLLASQWALIGQQEAFAGRTHDLGDELGSRLISAQLANYLIHLCFLMERRYAPYAKWLGTAFRSLACNPQIGPLLKAALDAAAYPAREAALASAYRFAAEMHNALKITPVLETGTRTYSGWHALRGGVTELALEDPRNTRPHQVIFAGRFADAIRDQIHDPAVLALRPNLGAVDQFLTGSSDALQDTGFCRALKDDLIQAEGQV